MNSGGIYHPDGYYDQSARRVSMNKTLNNLFIIASMGLAVSALIFILLAIVSDAEPEWILPAGLFCCALSNLFNLIRSMQIKSK